MDFKWFDNYWFLPETLLGFEWENPFWLSAIPFIPVLYLLKWLVVRNKRQKLEIARFTDNKHFDVFLLLRYIPILIQMLVFSLLLIALARPQKTNETIEQWTEGIDIVIALDISESMKLMDFTPNRLEAAKEVCVKFIEGRKNDRIGMVVFAGEAYTLAPLTTDYSLLKSLTLDVDFSMIQQGGTAIGNALAVSTNRLRESPSKSKVIVLLSDGESQADLIDPFTAANLAQAYHCKIYTIAVGKDGRVLYGYDPFGRPLEVENSLNETALRKIANIGQGKFFRATDNKALEKIFSTIDQMEKSEIKENRYKDTSDFYQIYLIWAALLFVLWMFLKPTFLSNLLED
ncbi:MAG: VWA domain-containing protein [Cytophagales bacterium]